MKLPQSARFPGQPAGLKDSPYRQGDHGQTTIAGTEEHRVSDPRLTKRGLRSPDRAGADHLSQSSAICDRVGFGSLRQAVLRFGPNLSLCASIRLPLRFLLTATRDYLLRLINDEKRLNYTKLP